MTAAENSGDAKRGGRRFTLYAHRGASGYAPENTLAAFRKALELGCPHLELDVHLARDGVPVVIHDATLNRTTDGRGRVGGYTLEHLKTLDAGSWFSEEFRGERIPTLEEVLALAGEGAKFCIEIKGLWRGRLLCRKVVEAIERFAALRSTTISSFHRAPLRELHEMDAAVRRCRLVRRGGNVNRAVRDAVRIGVSVVSLHADDINADAVERIHSQGLGAQAWGTKNDRQALARLIADGIDSMTSNWPDVVMDVLHGATKSRGKTKT